MENNPKDKQMSLSSWNYGSFSWTNPYYCAKPNLKAQPIKVYQNEYLNKENYIDGKNEKIVKNIYFENKDYMNYISRDNDPKNKRVKSAKNNINKIKKNNDFQIKFDDWKKKKDKNIRIEKMIKKKKLEEEAKNKNTHSEIRITYKKWLRAKIKSINKEKEKKLKKENQIKEEKKVIDEKRRENLINWHNNKKNLEIQKRKKYKDDLLNQKKMKKENEQKEKEKEEERKKLFKSWIENKDKQKKKNIKTENNKKDVYIKRKHSEVIGSYSYSKILRQMQNFYNNDSNNNNN